MYQSCVEIRTEMTLGAYSSMSRFQMGRSEYPDGRPGVWMSQIQPTGQPAARCSKYCEFLGEILIEISLGALISQMPQIP
jgi:hypothetical protein